MVKLVVFLIYCVVISVLVRDANAMLALNGGGLVSSFGCSKIFDLGMMGIAACGGVIVVYIEMVREVVMLSSSNLPELKVFTRLLNIKAALKADFVSGIDEALKVLSRKKVIALRNELATEWLAAKQPIGAL